MISIKLHIALLELYASKKEWHLLRKCDLQDSASLKNDVLFVWTQICHVDARQLFF